MSKVLSYTFLVIAFFIVYSIVSSGCAQIGAPTGGPKDTLPPVLVNADPEMLMTGFSGNKITLTFDEYVTVENIQTNLLVSPYPKKNPTVTFKLKTITIKLKDTLQDNTTYSINFGNAVKDVNEGNIFKNFTYVFSTGDKIDSMQVQGKVIMAETGKIDTTLLVFLYRNANDSSVQKRKPDYVAKLNGNGFFSFRNLPVDVFRIYALKDENGSKMYTSKFEEFAFADSDINTAASPGKIRLYAYAQEKEEKKKPGQTDVIKTSKNKTSKKFKYSITPPGTHDLLSPVEMDFSQQLKDIDTQLIRLTDTSFHKIKTELTVDSTRKKIFIAAKWLENTDYRLIVDTSAVSDSADEHLAKTDTVKLRTKQQSDYGTLLVRFTHVDYAKHPVLLLLKNDLLVKSIPIKASEWKDDLFPPGEYQLRILFDSNNNGKWDPGNYSEKIQPEHVVSLDKKLVIKADWDNERDIEL